MYLHFGVWVGFVAGGFVLGKALPGFIVLLVDGNLVGLVGLFVTEDVDFTFKAKKKLYLLDLFLLTAN